MSKEDDINEIKGIKFNVLSAEEIKEKYTGNSELTEEQKHLQSLYNLCEPMINTKVSDILKEVEEPNICSRHIADFLDAVSTAAQDCSCLIFGQVSYDRVVLAPCCNLYGPTPPCHVTSGLLPLPVFREGAPLRRYLTAGFASGGLKSRIPVSADQVLEVLEVIRVRRMFLLKENLPGRSVRAAAPSSRFPVETMWCRTT